MKQHIGHVAADLVLVDGSLTAVEKEESGGYVPEQMSSDFEVIGFPAPTLFAVGIACLSFVDGSDDLSGLRYVIGKRGLKVVVAFAQ